MIQLDFIGGRSPEAADRPRRQIANTRPSIAEQKAQLSLLVARLAMKPPASVASGSIQKTREWVAASQKAMALCKGARTSVIQLEMALKQLRGFES